jgi:hypothetical protein
VIANPSRELTEQAYYTVNTVVGTKQQKEAETHQHPHQRQHRYPETNRQSAQQQPPQHFLLPRHHTTTASTDRHSPPITAYDDTHLLHRPRRPRKRKKEVKKGITITITITISLSPPTPTYQERQHSRTLARSHSDSTPALTPPKPAAKAAICTSSRQHARTCPLRSTRLTQSQPTQPRSHTHTRALAYGTWLSQQRCRSQQQADVTMSMSSRVSRPARGAAWCGSDLQIGTALRYRRVGAGFGLRLGFRGGREGKGVGRWYRTCLGVGRGLGAWVLSWAPA